MNKNTTATITELRNEMADCNQAIKAFTLGLKFLAPGDLSEAPSIKWLQMQKNVLARRISQLRTR